MDAAVLDVDADKKDKNVVDGEEAKNEKGKGKVENVKKGEQQVQRKVRDEEVDAAVLDVEQEMDKGVLGGNEKAAEKDDDIDGNIDDEEEDQDQEEEEL
jgi:hypothetical protein